MQQPFGFVELLFENSTNPFDPSHPLFKFQRGIQPGFPTLVPEVTPLIPGRISTLFIGRSSGCQCRLVIKLENCGCKVGDYDEKLGAISMPFREERTVVLLASTLASGLALASALESALAKC